MLTRLRIDNLAVVESVDLHLAPGLNVLTGSTGAGKSLILGAVNLLTGERVPPDLIRRGADEAAVEAVFDVGAARMEEFFPETAPGEIVLRRRVSRSGRSHATINGRAATLKELRSLCSRLLEPHGQNEQFRLREPDTHVEYLDAFADNSALRRRYAQTLAELAGARAALERFDAEVARIREKRELTLHRIEDIERVAPRPGEKEALEASARLMGNAEKVHGALAEACAALYDDDDAAASQIDRARRRLAAAAPYDPRVAGIDEAIAQAAALVSGAAAQARSLVEGLDFEPDDVERVQERLDALTRLERRYQTDLGALLAQKDAWKRELDGLADAGEIRRAHELAVTRGAAATAEAGAELSASRRRAAQGLGVRVSSIVQGLGMLGAAVRVDVSSSPDPDSVVHVDGRPVAVFESGIDVVRLRVRTNPGEAEGPLEAVASTGELSRVALALKQSAPTAGHTGTTLILDEIDAGVGADLGEVLAENLLALASRHQILCITHLPQIAARGESHLVVLKESDGERTRVRVHPVERDERTREIARMLGGEEGSERRLALAAEMLSGGSSRRGETRVRP